MGNIDKLLGEDLLISEDYDFLSPYMYRSSLKKSDSELFCFITFKNLLLKTETENPSVRLDRWVNISTDNVDNIKIALTFFLISPKISFVQKLLSKGNYIDAYKFMIHCKRYVSEEQAIEESLLTSHQRDCIEKIKSAKYLTVGELVHLLRVRWKDS